MIMLSRRQYYRNGLIATLILGTLLLLGVPIALHYINNELISRLLFIFTWFIAFILITILAVWFSTVIYHGGFKNHFEYIRILNMVESNLISIGAYEKSEGNDYVLLPKIRVRENEIHIELKNLKIRDCINKMLDSFSTALPREYITEDYYISLSGNELIIIYEKLSNYAHESYTLNEYKELIKKYDSFTFYIDKKHTVDIRDYPHLLYSGGTGSGKSYAALQIVAQAILKDWDVSVLDIKRSYGIYRNYIDYKVEATEIVNQLKILESEMHHRLDDLESLLNVNPRALATDCGYRNKLVVIEEYISLQTALDKKDRDELERLVKNISVLARQACIHLLIVMQSAGTENINSSTRAQFTKMLLGQAQSNILNATFGNGVNIPENRIIDKGEGLIQLDRITKVRIPNITDIESFTK